MQVELLTLDEAPKKVSSAGGHPYLPATTLHSNSAAFGRGSGGTGSGPPGAAHLPTEETPLGVGLADAQVPAEPPERGFLPVLTTSDAPWSQVAPKVASDGQRAPLPIGPGPN